MKHLNRTDKDTANIYNIPEDEWKNDYRNLWYSEHQEQHIEIEDTDRRGPYQGDLITVEELKEALSRTKYRKPTGNNGMNTERLKYCDIFRSLGYSVCITCVGRKDAFQMHERKQLSSLIKEKKMNNCSNYTGINLIDTAYKIYTRVVCQRLQVDLLSEIFLPEKEKGFQKSRSDTGNVLTIKQLMEKRRQFNNTYRNYRL